MFFVHPLLFIFIFFIIIVPLILSCLNLYNLFSPKPFKARIISHITTGSGLLLTVFLYSLKKFSSYEIVLYSNNGNKYHEPFASKYFFVLVIIIFVVAIGYLLLNIKNKNSSPVTQAFAISSAYIGIIFSIFWIVQLSHQIGEITENLSIFFLCLFPFNYIICIIPILRDAIIENIENRKSKDVIYEKPILILCDKILSKSISWYILGFVFILPLAGILLIVLILFGQAPDSVIKLFTETSDWVLSQKISPPPIEYDYGGHYLCTVAANGHKKVVKPTRCGIRHGVKIVVNRQLCVANAFEQLISERVPKIHRFIRYIYDKYGYPLSKHITTKASADVTYIFMKPLEWFFVLVLYTFDKNPENRISMQYITPIKNSK
ncbi:MAG TPA: hypothetical protein DCP51_09100 [Clostridiales bacterium]|nr:hypothetical protein [Clostridiales bacterium]